MEKLSAEDRMFVLTGAGISAESGLPTFRGANGLWRGYRVEDVATPEAFAADPAMVWQFYSERRQRHLMQSRCSRALCTTAPFDDRKQYRTGAEIPHCRECGAMVRPHICWFGEVPFQMELILQLLEGASVLLTAGTSGVVEPAASFVRMARRNRARTIYIGPEQPSNSAYFDEVLLGKAGEALPSFVDVPLG